MAGQFDFKRFDRVRYVPHYATSEADCEVGTVHRVRNSFDLVFVKFDSPVCWVLEAVTKLSKPIPCKGAQGLWVLPAEIETLIWLDLAESDLAIKLKGVQS